MRPAEANGTYNSFVSTVSEARARELNGVVFDGILAPLYRATCPIILAAEQRTQNQL